MRSSLSIEEFGRQLISTGDLDPVYVALVGADLPRDQLARLLLSYWSFYHLGAASYMSEPERCNSYWNLMLTAAENTIPSPLGSRWPRSAERRHFRGPRCVAAVKWLSGARAEERIGGLATLTNEQDVMEQVKTWPLFGNWVAFKAADMLERVYGADVSFSADTVLMYEEPRRALAILDPQDNRAAYSRLIEHFARYKAPPRRDRPCGPQEVETVLCKWKSYLGGHYHVGKDIREVRLGLVGWGKTADRLLVASPEIVT